MVHMYYIPLTHVTPFFEEPNKPGEHVQGTITELNTSMKLMWVLADGQNYQQKWLQFLCVLT